VRGFAHQAAAGIVLCDLRHGTAHIDVDDVRTHRFHDACRFRHLVRITPENLYRNGPFFFGVFGVLERPVDAANETLEDTISVTTRPQAPWRLTSRRKAESVIPAIGATTKGEHSSTAPIFIRVRDS
jgi:hypothetical protein